MSEEVITRPQIDSFAEKPFFSLNERYRLDVLNASFDVTRLVESAIRGLPWDKLARQALFEWIQKMVRSIDFKPLIDEAVRLYVKETLDKIDICDESNKDYIARTHLSKGA
jgi:hypothetical protein